MRQLVFSQFYDDMQFTNADTFTILFPEGSTLHERILLLGATFLLNMMYFEEKNKKENDTGNSIDMDFFEN